MFSKTNNDDDLDAPRVAQWEGDESEEDAAALNKSERSQLSILHHDLSDLPLGILRAQQFVSQAEVESESEDYDSDDEDPQDSTPYAKDKHEGIGPNKVRSSLAKRSNKHAPMETTSKKPVTRRRTIVKVEVPQSRDPRFLPLAGEFSAEKFQAQYGFIADAHKAELDTLRQNLKRAKKLLSTSPQNIFIERDQEVKRLELAVKRAESMVNKDHKDMTERQALLKLTREEREKRKQGKKRWWMKESDKRDVLVRARYEALAAEGGGRAIKKAMEKRQTKISQKEKKSRPFPRKGFGDMEERSRRDLGQGQSSKRRRMA